jgi:hypothetical protein
MMITAPLDERLQFQDRAICPLDEKVGQRDEAVIEGE